VAGQPEDESQATRGPQDEPDQGSDPDRDALAGDEQGDRDENDRKRGEAHDTTGSAIFVHEGRP
jgi:hypothetical protein